MSCSDLRSDHRTTLPCACLSSVSIRHCTGEQLCFLHYRFSSSRPNVLFATQVRPSKFAVVVPCHVIARITSHSIGRAPRLGAASAPIGTACTTSSSFLTHDRGELELSAASKLEFSPGGVRTSLHGPNDGSAIGQSASASRRGL